MDQRRSACNFRTTDWTEVLSARTSPEDLGTLLERYWSPVYAFLRRRDHPRERAEDLTQQFLADVVLKRDLIGRADPARGRFRGFLLAALRNFVIDESRRRGPAEQAFLPDDPQVIAAAEPDPRDEPAAAFDRQWAATALNEALRRAEAMASDRNWSIWCALKLHPAVNGSTPPPVEDLVEAHQLAGRQTAYDIVQTVRRQVVRCLEEVVGETVADPSEIDAELAEVRRYLAL